MRSWPVASVIELSATEAAARIRQGELQAEDYAAALLDRESVARSLGALTWSEPQRVLADARRIDALRAAGKPLGMLGGVPIIIKDNIDTLGFPTSAGTQILKQYHPAADAPVVRALFDQGAILLAKANMHELAGGGTSNNPVFGAVYNPYDRSRVAGGSSGGTAAALAARFGAAGLGSDTAGSARIPASFCGICGFRPSTAGYKKFPGGGIVPLSFTLDTAGPMARSVADIALLNAAVTGAPVPRAASLAGLRIGLPKQLYWLNLDAETQRVARCAVDTLREAGVIFVDLDISSYIEGAQQLFFTTLMSDLGKDLGEFLRIQNIPLSQAQVVQQIASKDTYALFDSTSAFAAAAASPSEIKSLHATVANEYHEVLKRHGVEALCFPTEPIPAPVNRVGGDSPSDVVDVGGSSEPEPVSLVRNTSPVCALGAPALTLPAGLTRSGLPVGLELEGAIDADLRILSIGIAVQSALGSIPPPSC